mmetsp:Transcript_48850/g.95812  ORF Transcript_48850/g.95812 Transcript_48850/m.95812 type:complete len:362 (+) Transcript_48850:1-1086(+)
MNAGIAPLVLKNEGPSQNYFAFFEPFSGELWVLLLGTVVFVGTVTWLLEKGYGENSEFKDNWRVGVGSALYYASMSLFFAAPRNPKAISSRLVQIVWFFAIMIISSTYTANLAAFLVQNLPQKPFADILALPNDTPIAAFEGTAPVIWLENTKGFTNIRGAVDFVTGIRLLRNRTVKTLLMEEPFSRYQAQSNCDLDVVGGMKHFEQKWALAFNKRVPKELQQRVNNAMIKLWDNGYREKLIQRYWPVVDSCSLQKNATSQKQEATVQNLAGPFLLVAGTTVFVIFCRFFSCLFKCCQRLDCCCENVKRVDLDSFLDPRRGSNFQRTYKKQSKGLGQISRRTTIDHDSQVGIKMQNLNSGL